MKTYDTAAWLERLDPVKVEEPEAGREVDLRRISLASALLKLAEIDHEHEYTLCRSVAEHLLGAVPEPDDIGLDED